MATFEKVADADELQPGDRKSVFVDEIPALLFRVADDYYAVEDVCTHDGQPMTDGPLEGTQLTCPRHGACFDIVTGKATRMPATEPLETFTVEVREDGIYVSADADT